MRPGLAGSRGLECLPGAETLLQLLHPGVGKPQVVTLDG